ncbi:MAG TPA: glycosyltransferase [Xanthobacteraceae bacterium]|nr:glycosyltransferase [Xanthobacteraceae bacterium]
MLSVIIATLDSERALVPTLAALVPGATAGLISEVLVVDGGSRDDTAAVADVAGCNFKVLEGSLPRRLKAGAAAARAPWLLFLQPGTILEAGWPGEASRFLDHAAPNPRVAIFRRGIPGQPALRDALSLIVAAAFGAKPRAEQGLVISKQLYDQLGGHSETAADPEADLLRRIGRRRFVTLTPSAFPAKP